MKENSLKHEMKSWMIVWKSGRLRLVVGGKAKRTGIEVATQQGSWDSVEKGVEMGTIAIGREQGRRSKRDGFPHESSSDGAHKGNRAVKGTEQRCRET